MSDPSEPDAEPWISPLDAFAHSVGLVCQNWSLLEIAVRALLVQVAKMPDVIASDLVVRCFDFRDQLAAIKVGIAGWYTLSDKAVDEVIETVDYIDNVLRPRRNRVIHDLWEDEAGSKHALRMSTAPKVVRPQARARRIVWLEAEPELFTDVFYSAKVIGLHAGYVARLTTYLRTPTGREFLELTSRRPERPLFRPQQETQRPAGKPKRAPKRPRRSSPD